MTRTRDQNAAELGIAQMRMDQARNKLWDAVIAGDHAAMVRLEKVHAAAFEDYSDLLSEARFMDRHDYPA
jgi:hypothetical protein